LDVLLLVRHSICTVLTIANHQLLKEIVFEAAHSSSVPRMQKNAEPSAWIEMVALMFPLLLKTLLCLRPLQGLMRRNNDTSIYEDGNGNELILGDVCRRGA
jgi:hypothetical protein